MNLSALFLLILIFSPSFQDQKTDWTLPTTWTKDFGISTYSGGGMRGEAVEIKITYDECTYEEKLRGDLVKKSSFKMTDALRSAVLKKMQDLKVNLIRDKKSRGTTLDSESSYLCFQQGESNCVGEGGTTEIVKDYASNYGDAFLYLTEFANKKK